MGYSEGHTEGYEKCFEDIGYQCGSFTATTSSGEWQYKTITFPNAFSQTPYIYVANSNGGMNVYCCAENKSKTGFKYGYTAYRNDISTIFYWFAFEKSPF